MSSSSDSSDDDLMDRIIMSGYIMEDLFDDTSAKYSRKYIQLLEQLEDYSDQEGNREVDSTKRKGPNRNECNISDDYYAYDITSDEDSDTLVTPRLLRRKASKRTSKQRKQLENLKEAVDRQRKIELEKIGFLKELNRDMEERIEKKKKSCEEKFRQLDTSKMDEGQRKLHQKMLEKLKRDE